MATIGNLWINIKANTKALIRGIGGAKNSLAAFGKFMMNPAVLGVAAVAIAVAVWVQLGKAIVSGLSSAVKESAKFNQSMAKVGAVTLKTGKGFDLMRKKALDLGRTSVFTADQIAGGQLALAKAGLDASEVNETIEATAHLAAAADLDLAEASGVVVNAMRAFGLTAKDTTHIADVFAITMSRSNTTVLEMADALSYVAPVARALGFSLEHTSAMIGVLADAGIKGSMAGTGLRRVMSALATEIETHGVQALDNWITAQHTVSEDLLKFGLRGFNITQVLALMRKKMLELGQASLTASDVVKKMAEMRMDTLEGDFIKLKSAASGFKIIVGDELEPALRQITQVATHGLNAITLGLVEWLQGTKDLKFEMDDLHKTMETGFIVGMGFVGAFVGFFEEELSKLKILKNIGDIIVTGASFVSPVQIGSVSDKLEGLKTDFKELGEGIQGSLGMGGAEGKVQSLTNTIVEKMREAREAVEEEIKAKADKTGDDFLNYLGIKAGAEGLSKLDEDQIKILDKMFQFGEKLDDAWKFKGMEKFEIDAKKAIEVLKKLGGEEQTIFNVQSMVLEQKHFNRIISAEEEINSLWQKGNATRNSGLTILETYNLQLRNLHANTRLVEGSVEDYNLAWEGAMDNLIKKAKQMEDSVMTPFEKFEKEKLDIEQMFQLELINEETFSRLLKALEKTIEDSDLALELGLDTANVSKGFVASLDTALGTVKIGGESNQAVQVANQTLSVQENMNRLTESVATSVAKSSKALEGTVNTKVTGLQEQVTAGVNSAKLKVEVNTQLLTELQQKTIDITREYVGDTNNLLSQINDKIGEGGALT